MLNAITATNAKPISTHLPRPPVRRWRRSSPLLRRRTPLRLTRLTRILPIRLLTRLRRTIRSLTTRPPTPRRNPTTIRRLRTKRIRRGRQTHQHTFRSRNSTVTTELTNQWELWSADAPARCRAMQWCSRNQWSTARQGPCRRWHRYPRHRIRPEHAALSPIGHAQHRIGFGSVSTANPSVRTNSSGRNR